MGLRLQILKSVITLIKTTLAQNRYMRCLQLDFAPGLETSAPSAFGIRAAYLLSDHFNLIGNSTFLITIEEILNSFSFIQRIKLIKTMPFCEPALVEIIENYLHFQKEFKAMKHPPNNVFLAGKKMESALDTMMKDWIIEFKKNLHRDGFGDLLELIDDDCFDIHNADQTEGNSHRGHLCTLEVLKNLQPDGATGNSIWMMPDMFYHTNFFETLVATSVDMIEDDMPYVIKAFEFPNLNILNITELKSIKTQLNNQLVTFKKVAGEWAEQCYKSGGTELFINKVLPTFTDLQGIIDKNPILNHLVCIKEGQYTVSFYLGEVSPLILWKYYHYHGMITEEAYNDIVDKYNDMPNHTIPIMFYTPTIAGLVLEGEEDETAELEAVEDIKTVRKHINID